MYSHIYIYIYIYIYREREREIYIDIYICINIYIHSVSIISFKIANCWIFVVLKKFSFNGFEISVLFVRACVYICVWVRFCMWAHRCVHACEHMRRGMSDVGPSMTWFSHTTLLQLIPFQSWAQTSELLGRISTSELDPQPWHFTNNRINISSPDTSGNYACIYMSDKNSFICH